MKNLLMRPEMTHDEAHDVEGANNQHLLLLRYGRSGAWARVAMAEERRPMDAQARMDDAPPRSGASAQTTGRAATNEPSTGVTISHRDPPR
jgi:hypothetical protein